MHNRQGRRPIPKPLREKGRPAYDLGVVYVRKYDGIFRAASRVSMGSYYYGYGTTIEQAYLNLGSSRLNIGKLLDTVLDKEQLFVPSRWTRFLDWLLSRPWRTFK